MRNMVREKKNDKNNRMMTEKNYSSLNAVDNVDENFTVNMLSPGNT